MLFGKYHIVIFKEKSGASRNLRFRAWFGIFAFLLVAGLAVGNFWLVREFLAQRSLEVKLKDAERSLEEQHTQLIALAGRLSEVQTDLERVRDFDTRLRLMMNMERGDAELTDVGAGRKDEFSMAYLPLHRQELALRRMNAFLKQLSTDTRLEEVRQQELFRTMRKDRSLLASLPSIWPIDGFITSRFGARPSPFTGRGEFHKGLDISAKTGTIIRSPGKATVTFSGVDGAYGNSAMLDHGGGITTRYAHMQRIAVKEGQIVRRGDIVGFVGSTGRSSGPHLHYEVRLNGVNVDPMRYILN